MSEGEGRIGHMAPRSAKRTAARRRAPVLSVGPGDRPTLAGGKGRGRAGGGGRGRRKATPPRKRRGLFGRIVYWGAVLGLWGVVALGGLVAYYAADMPPTSDWAVPARPPNVRILDDQGRLIGNRGDTGGEAVRLGQLPSYLPNAVIAIEDHRFRAHFGVDPIGLVRAAWVNLTSGGVVQGGSTLTQQLAKNLFLEPARTFERKVQEAILALWLETRYSKDQILELYLNRVYFGAGAYGVDAAARRYFGKSAREVTLSEAAMLAGLLKAPAHYSPLSAPREAKARAATVLEAMVREGFISGREAEIAIAHPAVAHRDAGTGSANYVADWVMDLLPGYIGSVSQDIIVETTVDLDMQRLAERALVAGLERDSAKYGVRQGAVVMMEPTGAVRALVGGRSYQKSQFNRAVDAHRQPGSAFKPFVYLAALEAGLTPQTVRVDRPVSINGWRPENYTHKHYGPVTLAQGLAMSLNTIAAQLAAEVGPDRVVAVAHRLGITSRLPAVPSIALGTAEVTPLELVTAYVPFANGGYGVVPHVIRRIRTSTGTVLYQRSSSGMGQVIDPVYVGEMNQMLAGVLEVGTARDAHLGNRPAAGKTGTTQDYRDAWFVGYTANLVTGVWLGNDDNAPTKRATGGSLAADIWHDIMMEAHEGVPVSELPGLPRRPVVAEGPVPPAGIPDGQPAARMRGDWVPPPPGPNPLGFLRRLFGG